MIKRFFAMVWLSMLFVISMFALPPEPAHAAEFSRNLVPDGLKTWIPWVLDEAGEAACPHWYNSNEQRLCAWPASLELKASQKNAGFTQDWQVYQTTWVTLPGDAKVWPEQVTDNGKPLL